MMRWGFHFAFSCLMLSHATQITNPESLSKNGRHSGSSSSSSFDGLQSEDDALELYRDRYFIRRAISLASLSQGRTRPNPCVGCIILDKHGVVVGEGWHVKAGEAHAEVVALSKAGNRSVDGVAYVTLEPCNHFGRTPPCSSALVRSGICRVVAGMIDPDPRVSGNGLFSVKGSGADVKLMMGVESTMCQEINAPFVFRVLYERPHCTLWGGYTAAIDYVKHYSDVTTSVKYQSVEEADSVRRFVRSAFVDVDVVTITRGVLLDMALHGRLGLLLSLLPTSTCIIVMDDSHGTVSGKLDSDIERVINATREQDIGAVHLVQHRSWFVETVVQSQEAAQHVYLQDSHLPSVALLFSNISRGKVESTDGYVRRSLLLLRGCNLSSNSILVPTDDVADLARLTEAGLVQRLYLSYRSESSCDDTQPSISQYSCSLCPNGWDDWLSTEELEAAHCCRAAIDEAQTQQRFAIMRRLAELGDRSSTTGDQFRSMGDLLTGVRLTARKDEGFGEQSSSESSPFGRTRSWSAGLGRPSLRMYRTNLWIPPPPSA